MATVKEQKDLWDKIQSFSLDDEKAVVKFSDKLSSKQNWAPSFTKRAIEEYRKFILLCCISEKGASPSQIVDEVWHLHLTYTQSYWIDFCKNTLDKQIHHHPSAGGDEEHHKHEEWYKETLQLYEIVFGVAPPSDIWPHPREEAPVIEIVRLRLGTRTRILMAALLLFPFLFILARYGEVNPYFLNGPAFLWFFPLWGIALIVSYTFRQQEERKQLNEITSGWFPDDASIFQMSKFLYGKHRALQTAIVDLVRRGLLEVDRKELFTVKNGRYIPDMEEENPLAGALVKEPNGERFNYKALMKSWYNEEKFSHPALRALYDVAFSKGHFFRENWYFLLFYGVGLTRIAQGMFNDRPLGFLVAEIFIFSIVIAVVSLIFSTRVRVFKKVEALYKQKLLNRPAGIDPVVCGFFMEGVSHIKAFGDGIIMAGIFSAYGSVSYGGGDGGSSSCSSCSGGGGGGCGGGGCGGCGGH